MHCRRFKVALPSPLSPPHHLNSFYCRLYATAVLCSFLIACEASAGTTCTADAHGCQLLGTSRMPLNSCIRYFHLICFVHPLAKCHYKRLQTDGNGSEMNTYRGRGRFVMHAHRPTSVVKLGRPSAQRKALLRALTTQVIRHGKITTTEAKAKAVRRYLDKMIGLAKRGDLHAFRQAIAWIYDKPLVFALFKHAPLRYAERRCGYCRLTKLRSTRKGDSARMAQIELL